MKVTFCNIYFCIFSDSFKNIFKFAIRSCNWTSKVILFSSLLFLTVWSLPYSEQKMSLQDLQSVFPVSVTHFIPTVWFSCFACCFISETEGECPSHLIVLCRGRVFAFDAIHEGGMVTPPEIFRFSNYLVSNELSYLRYIPKRIFLFLSHSPQSVREATASPLAERSDLSKFV